MDKEIKPSGLRISLHDRRILLFVKVQNGLYGSPENIQKMPRRFAINERGFANG
jgi:hypothetical protein